MKSVALLMMAMLAATLAGCGSDSPAAATDTTQTQQVMGLSTPTSVSVVTAN